MRGQDSVEEDRPSQIAQTEEADMRRQFISISLVVVIILGFAGTGEAKRLVLKPARVTSMTSPDESRDERVLVYFDLPEGLKISPTEIDFAKLVFKAQIADAASGQLQIYPLTSSWKDTPTLGWEQTWDKAGGDYSIEHPCKHISIRSDEGLKSLRFDVTFVVLAWLDGTMENHGFIVVPSKADLRDSDVEFTFDTSGMELVISYNPD